MRASVRRAKLEFEKLFRGNEYTTDDVRQYGILHQYMMNYCKDKALEAFNQVIAQGASVDAEIYYRTKRQKLYLLSQIGAGRECVEDQLKLVQAGNGNPEEWILLIAAYFYSGDMDAAYKWYQKAAEKFPKEPGVYTYGGDVCRQMKKYEEAFACWDKALELDCTYYAAAYSRGECYEELEEYEKAADVWQELMQHLTRDGYEEEIHHVKSMADRCKKKLKQ